MAYDPWARIDMNDVTPGSVSELIELIRRLDPGAGDALAYALTGQAFNVDDWQRGRELMTSAERAMYDAAYLSQSYHDSQDYQLVLGKDTPAGGEILTEEQLAERRTYWYNFKEAASEATGKAVSWGWYAVAAVGVVVVIGGLYFLVKK